MKVVPLFKNGDSLIVDNYRSTSPLPWIMKVFEKAVYIQLSEYAFFYKENVFLWRIIPIREKHSTKRTTLKVMDQIISTLDQKHLQLSIFMDLFKSSNMLNHKIFLKNYIMVLCYTGFPFILSTESNIWNWIACNLPHQCSTQVYHKDLSWVQFGSWYIYIYWLHAWC